MTSKPFVLEDRYIVIKRSDLDAVWQGTVRAQFLAGLHRLNEHNVRIPQRQYLVIESDWPEFYPALQMLKTRIDGAVTETQHQEVAVWIEQENLDELHSGKRYAVNAYRNEASCSEAVAVYRHPLASPELCEVVLSILKEAKDIPDGLYARAKYLASLKPEPAAPLSPDHSGGGAGMVLPIRQPEQDCDYTQGWNACLDKVKELNP